MTISTDGRPKRRLRRLAAAGLALAAMISGVVAGPATAATPKMTVKIAPVTTSVASGGQAVFRITYECSNVTSENCVAPQLAVRKPVGAGPDGGSVNLTGNAVVQQNTDVNAVVGAATTLPRIQLKDLAPGTTGEVTVAWTIPNYTTLPGTTFLGEVTLSYNNGSGTQVVNTTADDVISSTATPSLQLTKQTITPDNAAKVEPDKPVTYRLYACSPAAANVGSLDYKNLTIVDQLPVGAQFVSATAGGTYNASNGRVTWTIPNPTSASSCSNPPQPVEITVIYPSASFVPPAATPQQTRSFQNTATATATALDGTPVNANAAQTHTFIGPPLTGGTNNFFYTQKGSVGSPIANTNTTTEVGWNTLIGWGDRAAPGPQYDRLRVGAINDRMPCLIGGAAVSPPISTWSTAFPGTLPIPADQCKNPAYKTTSVQFKAPERANRLNSVQVVTWNGSVARTYSWTVPAGWKPDRAMWVYVYPLPAGGTGNPFDASLNVPANEIVTDIRVTMRDLPQNGGDGSWVDFSGTATPAFAASGLLVMTNTTRTQYSPEYAPGSALPTSLDNPLGPYSALKNFYLTQPDPQVTKRAVTPVTNLKPGDETTWSVAISNGPNGNIPMRPQLVDVLPPGMNYVDGSASWSNLGSLGTPTLTQGKIVIGGQERTRLTWTWPASAQLKTGDAPPTVTFRTVTGLIASTGTHTGDESQTAVLFDQNRTLTDPGTGGPRDKWDLNGNGNTTELVGQSTVAWTVQPSAGASISKLVKGALDADWTTNGLTNATFTGADSQVDYRLQITNPNTAPLTNVTVYDLFPRVGDTAIGGSLAGTPRGSEWASLFQGMTSVPAGATVSYSTSINPCRPELFGGTAGQALPVGCTNSWTTTPPFDPRAVRAIKVTVPRVDPSATPTNIDFRMNAPALTGASDQAITNPGAVSNNNVAWSAFRASSPSASDSLLASEAPAVSVRRAAGQIGDRVWLDTNRNGLQDAGEPGVAGVTVELRDSAGNTVRDASNAPIRTTTDADGTYRFTVPLGTWSVAFLSVPAGYQLTASKVGSDDTIDSDATALGAATHTVTVTDPIRNGAGANVNLDLDAGLVTNGLSWEKVDATDAGHRLGGSEWTLTPVDAGNTPIGAPIAVTDCVAANAAACTGRDVDPGSGTFSVEGLTSGRWRLVETKAPAGYKLDPAPRYIEVSGATKFAAPITNVQQEVPTIPLTGGTGSFLFWATAGGLTALVALGLAAQRIRRRRTPLTA